LIIMFILNFTLFCFMSRISTPMKYSSQDRVKMVSILYPGSSLLSRQFLKPIGLSAFLLLLICGIVA
jgi:hypothetical protein